VSDYQKYRVYDLKCNPTTITYYSIKIKSKAGPPHATDSDKLPHDT
jgi:hypothetical protein